VVSQAVDKGSACSISLFSDAFSDPCSIHKEKKKADNLPEKLAPDGVRFEELKSMY
jgi:hypothetical protein